MSATQIRSKFSLKAAVAALALAGGLVAASTSASADPPSWAPAHGWRAQQAEHQVRVEKHDPSPSGKQEQHARQRLPQIEGSELGCNSDVIGAVAGGALGAAIGSQIGDGDGQTAAIIGGAILGLLAGNVIGQSVDSANEDCIRETMETVPDWQPVVWHEPTVHRTGSSGSTEPKRYALTPTRTYTSPAGFLCRDYVTTVTVDGQVRQATGTACREPDGRWRVVA